MVSCVVTTLHCVNSVQFSSIQSTLFIPHGTITSHSDGIEKKIKLEWTISSDKDVNTQFLKKSVNTHMVKQYKIIHYYLIETLI